METLPQIIVTKAQFNNGYYERKGNLSHKVPYTKIGENADGTFLVKNPHYQAIAQAIGSELTASVHDDQYYQLLRSKIEAECYEELNTKFTQMRDYLVDKANTFLETKSDQFYEDLLAGKGSEARRKVINELKELIRQEWEEAKKSENLEKVSR